MSACWPARCPGQPGTSSSSVDADGVSRITSRTVAGRQPTWTSVAPVALLTPRIPVVVVAERLPEAGLVGLRDLDLGEPLGALPEVQVRHEQPCRAAVLGLERRAVERVHDPRLAIGD